MIMAEGGMLKKHKECLRLNYTYLTRDILMNELKGSLKEINVMKEDWIDNIMCLPANKQCGELLDHLKRAGPYAWDRFLQSLENSAQGHIAWRLRETERLYEANPKITAPELKKHFEKNPPPSNVMPRPPSNAPPDIGYKAKLSKGDCYKMESTPRGLMLIINNVKFEDGQETRQGSEVDKKRLTTIFHDFGFQVEHTHTDNLTKELMIKRIKRFAEDANNYENIDSVVVAVLSHGEDDKIYGVDGLWISIDDLTRPFNGQNCRNLAGKPKLFILQVCRGRDYRMGIPAHDGPAEGPNSGPGSKMIVEGGEPNDPQDISENEKELSEEVLELWISDQQKTKEYIHRHEQHDMILAYSTLPDQVSNRDCKKGSWYVQALCNVFVNHAHDTHVADMLVRTNREMTKFGNLNNVQCPQPIVMLLKDWYLNPIKSDI